MDPLLRSNRNPAYRTWKAMKKRCLDAENEDYGGRGITFCPAWADFDQFINDMGQRPEGMTLDRVDGDGPYCPENCRWQTPEQQANNRRSSRMLTHEGQTMSVTQWARHLGVSDQTLFYRLRAGWPVPRVLTAPLSKQFRGNQWTK